MTLPPNRIEAAARAIATANGDDFDAIPKHKGDWVDARGTFSGRFRDINEPMQADYVAMAEAAVAAFSPELANGTAWVAPIEATDDMEEAFFTVGPFDGGVFNTGDIGKHWAAMRNAFLQEPKDNAE